MKKVKKNTIHISDSKQFFLEKAANVAFQKAAKSSMQVMGYSILIHDGWVVKKHANGLIEKIEQI